MTHAQLSNTVEDNDWDESFGGSSGINSRSTGSSLSLTDDGDGEATELLRDQFLKFENYLYDEIPNDDLPEDLLEEAKQWAEHSTNLRVVGTKMPIYELEEGEAPPDEEIGDEDKEEDLLDTEETGGDDSLGDEEPLDEENDTGEVFEAEEELEEVGSPLEEGRPDPSEEVEVFLAHDDLNEALDSSINESPQVKALTENAYNSMPPDLIKRDVKKALVRKLFQHVWPTVAKKVEPLVRYNPEDPQSPGYTFSEGENVRFHSLPSPSQKNHESFYVLSAKTVDGPALPPFYEKNGLYTVGHRMMASSSSEYFDPPSNAKLKGIVPQPHPLKRVSSLSRNARSSRAVVEDADTSSELEFGDFITVNNHGNVLGKSNSFRKMSSGSSSSSGNSLRHNSTSPRRFKHGQVASARLNSRTSDTPQKFQEDLFHPHRHGILPPIETLEITPKVVSKRSTSAMTRLNRNSSFSRPNTSRNKPHSHLNPIEQGVESLPRGRPRIVPVSQFTVEPTFKPIESFPPSQNTKPKRKPETRLRWRV